MTPIKLRTVRPFVIEEVSLAEAGEEEGVDLSDQMEVSKFLKAKVRPRHFDVVLVVHVKEH
jgi:double-strand break repair protein MRE11